ncbi:MAG: hypothetical protein V2A54_08880 [Bacteroidota bacterium]
MKKLLLPLLVAFAVSLVSCGGEKKEEKKVNEDSIKVAKEKAKDDSIKAATAKKESEADMDASYLKDEKGQWVVKATASTTYASKKGKAPWSPEQMIGKPDVQKYGDNQNAWASKERDGGMEWVKLTFEKEVNATEIRIKETYNAGAISKIELIDTKNKSHVVYEATAAAKDKKMQYLVATFEKTAYKTKTVKITIDSKAVEGWNEIDAVQLVGE